MYIPEKRGTYLGKGPRISLNMTNFQNILSEGPKLWSKLSLHLFSTANVELQNWPHLRDLPFADPHYFVSSKVDPVLCVNVYPAILKEKVVHGPIG